MRFTESTLEEAVIDYLASLGWQAVFGPEIAPGEPATQRDALLPRLMSGDVKVKGMVKND